MAQGKMSLNIIMNKLRRFAKKYECIKDGDGCEIKPADYLRSLDMIIKLQGLYDAAKNKDSEEDEELEFVI